MAAIQTSAQAARPNTTPSLARPASATTSPTVNTLSAQPTAAPTTPNPSPTIPAVSSPLPTTAPTVATDLDRDNSEATDSEPITQTSVIAQPQTIPIDPSDPNASSSSASSSRVGSSNPHSLPVIAVVIIAIVFSLLGLIIVYRLYRRVSYTFFKRNRRTDAPELVFSPPPPPPLDPGIIPTSRFMMTASGHQGNFQSRTGASIARSSMYFPNHQYQQPPDLGLLLGSPDKYDQVSTEEFGSRVTRDSMLGTGSEFTSDLSSMTRSSSPLMSLTNPLLSTRDHSTLSTDTLKHASRRASMTPTNRHSFYDLTPNINTSPQIPLEQRMSRVGLPHLSKNRFELSLPSPLGPSQGLVNISHQTDRRLDFSPQSGIGIGLPSNGVVNSRFRDDGDGLEDLNFQRGNDPSRAV